MGSHHQRLSVPAKSTRRQGGRVPNLRRVRDGLASWLWHAIPSNRNAGAVDGHLSPDPSAESSPCVQATVLCQVPSMALARSQPSPSLGGRSHQFWHRQHLNTPPSPHSALIAREFPRPLQCWSDWGRLRRPKLNHLLRSQGDIDVISPVPGGWRPRLETMPANSGSGRSGAA